MLLQPTFISTKILVFNSSIFVFLIFPTLFSQLLLIGPFLKEGEEKSVRLFSHTLRFVYDVWVFQYDGKILRIFSAIHHQTTFWELIQSSLSPLSPDIMSLHIFSSLLRRTFHFLDISLTFLWHFLNISSTRHNVPSYLFLPSSQEHFISFIFFISLIFLWHFIDISLKFLKYFFHVSFYTS